MKVTVGLTDTFIILNLHQALIIIKSKVAIRQGDYFQVNFISTLINNPIYKFQLQNQLNQYPIFIIISK